MSAPRRVAAQCGHPARGVWGSLSDRRTTTPWNRRWRVLQNWRCSGTDRSIRSGLHRIYRRLELPNRAAAVEHYLRSSGSAGADAEQVVVRPG